MRATTMPVRVANCLIHLRASPLLRKLVPSHNWGRITISGAARGFWNQLLGAISQPIAGYSILSAQVFQAAPATSRREVFFAAASHMLEAWTGVPHQSDCQLKEAANEAHFFVMDKAESRVDQGTRR